jgi:hypothetical protein
MQGFLRRGDDVAQMMQVTGEECVSMEDHLAPKRRSSLRWFTWSKTLSIRWTPIRPVRSKAGSTSGGRKVLGPWSARVVATRPVQGDLATGSRGDHQAAFATTHFSMEPNTDNEGEKPWRLFKVNEQRLIAFQARLTC